MVKDAIVCFHNLLIAQNSWYQQTISKHFLVLIILAHPTGLFHAANQISKKHLFVYSRLS